MAGFGRDLDTRKMRDRDASMGGGTVVTRQTPIT